VTAGILDRRHPSEVECVLRDIELAHRRDYPGPKETVFMAPEEALAFAQDMKWERKIAATKKTA